MRRDKNEVYKLLLRNALSIKMIFRSVPPRGKLRPPEPTFATESSCRHTHCAVWLSHLGRALCAFIGAASGCACFAFRVTAAGKAGRPIGRYYLLHSLYKTDKKTHAVRWRPEPMPARGRSQPGTMIGGKARQVALQPMRDSLRDCAPFSPRR